jgi:hypothetical protein
MKRVFGLAAFFLLALSAMCVADVPDLTGLWAMVQVYPQISIVPFAGEVTRTSTVLQLVEIEQDGDTLIMNDRYCATLIDDGTPLVRTTIPEAFMMSLRPAPRIAILEDVEGVIQFTQAMYIEVRGAVLENPEVDPLPDHPEDPRVFDQDEDGHPGMSVSVVILGMIEGRIFVVQRVQYALTGRVTSDDSIEGTIRWSDEQLTLGATTPLLLADAVGIPDPDPSAHVFRMRRVDESWTCERLREQWQALFEWETQAK